MQDKLRALTEKLYQEGIEAGQNQGEVLLIDAKKKAEKIVEDAQSKAKEILEKAQSDSALKHKQAMSELKLASQKATNSIKHSISKLISDKLFNAPVEKAMKDNEFIQEMILTILESWASKKGEEMDVKVHISKVKESEIKKFITTKCKAFLDNGCEIVFDDGVSSGFKIGPKDGSYMVEFSEDSFKSFFKNYLRSEVQNIAFGKEA
jgi:V/A-type H+/Na+-transporting ATPase subunit E